MSMVTTSPSSQSDLMGSSVPGLPETFSFPTVTLKLFVQRGTRRYSVNSFFFASAIFSRTDPPTGYDVSDSIRANGVSNAPGV